jgi:hypothetical protein
MGQPMLFLPTWIAYSQNVQRKAFQARYQTEVQEETSLPRGLLDEPSLSSPSIFIAPQGDTGFHQTACVPFCPASREMICRRFLTLLLFTQLLVQVLRTGDSGQIMQA